ncbi:hypothetical protein KY348_05375 [Candidatus Woesearchaeota archaeon]|nr:hypothetical protein [Candidatus Woesearchaeota archaeon]
MVNGGKSRGLEQLLQHTALGYDVPEYEQIDTALSDSVERQYLMAKMASLINARRLDNKEVVPFAPTRLPDDIQKKS